VPTLLVAFGLFGAAFADAQSPMVGDNGSSGESRRDFDVPVPGPAGVADRVPGKPVPLPPVSSDLPVPSMAMAGATQAAAPANPAPTDQTDQIERLKKQIDLQEQQMQLLRKMIGVLDEQAKQQPSGETIDDLQAKEAALEARAQQGAQRDKETADQIDGINERMDADKRYGPWLPAPLKELFLPSGTAESPLNISGQFMFEFDQPQQGQGNFTSADFSPYFHLVLDQDWLLAANIDISNLGVAVGEAQFNWFANDWLTVVGGRYLTPIGFFNERLNHEWINRLPDPPLMFLQVSPQSSTDGLELRGAHYLFDSPVKMEYSFYGGNGFQAAGTSINNLADLESISGVDEVNTVALGTRVGLWIPEYGLTGGASYFHSFNYIPGFNDDISLWQLDCGYRKGNWDLRFEYAQMYQEAADVLGNNIQRNGLYAQVAYRPYDADNFILRNLEYTFRYSQARFHGIDPLAIDPTAFAGPVDVPVDRNQYTFGLTYYFRPAVAAKFAYEINQELGPLQLNDNEFIFQFVWAF
jgi:hypothetical protein